MELFEKEVKRLKLDKICEGDKYMELFEKEVKRLNQNQKFTEFMSAKEEEEKLKKTLIEDAKNEGLREKQIEIAKNMLENKMDLKLISKLTGLSIDEVETLKLNF